MINMADIAHVRQRIAAIQQQFGKLQQVPGTEFGQTLARAIHENARRLGKEAGLPLDLTVSIGCALLADEDYEAAYKKADRALYAAKEKGRNTYVILPAEGARQQQERKETP